MKKMILILALATGGVSFGMQDAINDEHWGTVSDFIVEAQPDQINNYVTLLVNSKKDLNYHDDNTRPFLYTLAFSFLGCKKSHYRQDAEKEQAEANVTLALTELMRHNKLNPDLEYKQRLVVKHVDGIYYDNGQTPFTDLVKNVCQQVSNEEIKSMPWHFTARFHTSEKSISPNGFAQRKPIWHPLCLLVDYRVWAAACVVFIASCAYKMYTDKSEDEDEQEEVSSDEKSLQQELVQ